MTFELEERVDWLESVRRGRLVRNPASWSHDILVPATLIVGVAVGLGAAYVSPERQGSDGWLVADAVFLAVVAISAIWIALVVSSLRLVEIRGSNDEDANYRMVRSVVDQLGWRLLPAVAPVVRAFIVRDEFLCEKIVTIIVCPGRVLANVRNRSTGRGVRLPLTRSAGARVLRDFEEAFASTASGFGGRP